MAQAAHAITTSGHWFRQPANDNDRRPGGTDADRWHWLIERFKAIDTALAVFAAKERLKGVKCQAFCMRFLRGAQLAGWDCVLDCEG